MIRDVTTEHPAADVESGGLISRPNVVRRAMADGCASHDPGAALLRAGALARSPLPCDRRCLADPDIAKSTSRVGRARFEQSKAPRCERVMNGVSWTRSLRSTFEGMDPASHRPESFASNGPNIGRQVMTHQGSELE
ncbi:hypothetical protein B1810_14375 [Panacagrimonas perspica]|nr:hypothetical protein B1810_14375 [Panacagrimonas perspica]